MNTYTAINIQIYRVFFIKKHSKLYFEKSGQTEHETNQNPARTEIK